MAAALLAFSLLLSGPQELCARLYSQARSARDAHLYTALAKRARQARLCYGERAPEERVMRLYSWEGYGLFKTGQPERAMRRYDEFFERFTPPPDSLRFWFRHMHRQRGYLYYSLGNLSAAARDYARALSYATSTRKRADLSVDLGNVFQRMRAFRAARRHYRRAEVLLQALDEQDGEIRALRAEVMLARADLLLEAPALAKAPLKEDWREVIRRCERALALLGKNAQSEDVLSARVRLADAHGSLGEVAQAHRDLDRALRQARQVGSGHWQFWLTYKRGWLYLKAGALEQAEASFQKALDQVDQARHADYRRRLLESLGEIYETMERPARAEKYYRRAIAVVEDYRAALGTTDWAAQAFSEWQAPYRGLVRALLAQKQPRAAFRALERSRARHLRDLRTQARMLSTLEASERQRFDSLTTALSEVRTRLGNDTLRAPARARLERRETRLTSARNVLVPSASPRRASLSLGALQQTLAPRNRVLLSYFIDNPDSLFARPSRSTAFVLTEDRFAAVPLVGASADTLTSLLKAVSPLLRGEDASNLNAVHFALGPLNALYDRLLAPLRAHFAENAPLVIVPDGPLYTLPFSTLVTEPTPPYRYRAAPFLIRRHPLTTELAASLLLADNRRVPPRASEARRPGSAEVAAFGKAHFADLAASEAFQNSPFRTDSLPALPGVEEEIGVVRRIFADARIAVGKDATAQNLVRAMQHAKVLHVASHAFASTSSPLQSAILLSREPREEAAAADGVLYLHELPRGHLATRLAVLSGCSTARGVLRPGEGMAGFQYGFRSAGVASTLSMLWPAEDGAAARLMERFYRHLRAGAPQDVALQKAQRAILEGGDAARRSPFFWAGAVLYGDAAPLALEKPSLWVRHRNAALGLALCMLLLVVGLLFYRRSR